MIQQVNLYSDLLRFEQEKSKVNFYWLSVPLIILLMIGFSGYCLWDAHRIEQQVQQLRHQMNGLQDKIRLVSSQLPKQELDAELEAEVTLWQTKLDELAKVYQLLLDNKQMQRAGFSGYFQALSNQSIPEVWLTAMFFDEQQQIINLEGGSFDPDKIPYFLQRLQKEPVFNGRSFAKLVMESSEQVPGQMNFRLNTALNQSNKTTDKHESTK